MEIFTPPPIKEKRPPGRQSKVSVEYQMMIARKCIEEGMSYREAAKTFNVSHSSVYAFIQKYKVQNGKIKRKERRQNIRKKLRITGIKLN